MMFGLFKNKTHKVPLNIDWDDLYDQMISMENEYLPRWMLDERNKHRSTYGKWFGLEEFTYAIYDIGVEKTLNDFKDFVETMGMYDKGFCLFWTIVVPRHTNGTDDKNDMFIDWCIKMKLYPNKNETVEVWNNICKCADQTKIDTKKYLIDEVK